MFKIEVSHVSEGTPPETILSRQIVPELISDRKIWDGFSEDVRNLSARFLELPETSPSPPRIINGEITLCKGSDVRTFLVKTALDGKLRGKRIIHLIHEDNTEDAFGFVNDEVGVKVWHSKIGTPKKPSIYEWYADFLNVLVGRYESTFDKADQYKEQMNGTKKSRCVKCNRPLTTEWSKQHGVGVICARE